MIFYLQVALTGSELGYFNSGYLCKELHEENFYNCIEQFLNMYLMVHGDNMNTDSYALLNVAEYYQEKNGNLTRAIDLYTQLYRNGDPQVRRLMMNFFSYFHFRISLGFV